MIILKIVIPLLILSLPISSRAQGVLTSFLQPQEGISLPAGVEVYFSPVDDLESQVVELIQNAETEIVFNAHSITSHKILSALMDAYINRKIFIAGLLDQNPSVQRYSTFQYFRLNGLPFAHPLVGTGYNDNSYIVVDRRVVVTGSYQFTKGGSSNHENIIILYEPGVACSYYNHFVATFDTSMMPTTQEAEKK